MIFLTVSQPGEVQAGWLERGCVTSAWLTLPERISWLPVLIHHKSAQPWCYDILQSKAVERAKFCRPSAWTTAAGTEQPLHGSSLCPVS
jgi:hypothetical protein